MAEVRLSIAEVEAIVAQLRRVATRAGAGLPIDTEAVDRTADALADLAFQTTEGGEAIETP